MKFLGIAAIVVAAFVLNAYNAAAAPAQKRLIEYAEGKQKWMTEDEIASVSFMAHRKGICPGFMDITDHVEAYATPAKPFHPLFIFDPPEIKNQEVVNSLISGLSMERLYNNVRDLSAFANRKHDSEEGEKAAMWIKERFETIATDNSRDDVTVIRYEHRFRQPSIIAEIKGKDKEKSNEIIIVGAHEDSIGGLFGFGRVAPGADDDASGTSTVIEVFQTLIEGGYRPDRTIQFMTYAGEEKGLLGSQDIAQHYRRERKTVVAVIQFDMTFYPGGGEKITLISDNVNEALTGYLEGLIDEYVKIPHQRDRCGYGCSDHASWTRAGYASAFPFESPFANYNKKIHTPNDKLDILDASFGMHFAKIGVAFAAELGLP